jgi:peptide/nickel transport system substrate-binding protein
MKKLRWQLIIIFLTGLVVGILLLNEQPGVQMLTSATPEPARGGVYTEALVGSMLRLNPVLDFNNTVDRDVNRLVYSGLIRFDSNGSPVRDLAESWGVTQDGTIYNFSLRPGVKWHDGQPLTADDVVFTIDLLRNGGGVVPKDLQDFWKEVEVTSLSETVLQFRLPEPFAPFLDYLSFGVLPKHKFEGQTIDQVINSPVNLQPVGSGPFRVEKLLVEDNRVTGVVLTVFKDYYEKKPYLDQIIFKYYPDANSALKAYREGAVQGIGHVTPDILQAALAEPTLSVYTARQPEMAMLLFNLKNTDVPFLEDVAVRKALMTGLNRQLLIDRALQGQAILANGPILPGTWAYYDGIVPPAFDTEAAQKALKEAGYVLAKDGDTIRKKNDVSLAFTIIFPDDDKHRALAEMIQKDWLALDIKVDIEAVPYDQLITNRLEQRNFQVALVELNLSRSPDPDPYPFWDQAQMSNGQNYTQWDNRVASEYLEQGRVAVEYAERVRLYRNFQIIFNKDLPAIPLFYSVYNYAVDQQVQGVQLGPVFDSSDRFMNVLEWHMGRKAPSVTPTPNK